MWLLISLCVDWVDSRRTCCCPGPRGACKDGYIYVSMKCARDARNVRESGEGKVEKHQKKDRRIDARSRYRSRSRALHMRHGTSPHSLFFTGTKKISHPNDAGIFNQQYFTYIVITGILSEAAKVGNITLCLVG